MSMSSKGDSTHRAGFTLIEALVALVVAGFLLPSLARALGEAWAATRTPMDIISGMILARDVEMGTPVPADIRARGFAAERTGGSVTVLVLPSDVAPAPAGTGKNSSGKTDNGDLKPDATPSAMKLAAPTGFGGPPQGAAGAVNLKLRRITVVAHTPMGRRIPLQGVRLGDDPS